MMIKMIETDKSRDVRRGASRFSRQIKQSGLKLVSALNGDFLSLEKTTKERIKKLSAVNRETSSKEENYEMGCDVADREEVLPSQAPSISGSGASKRFKLPRKQFFDNCNGVAHVSVPRKLRSAMKKRNRESISPPLPDSKKLNHSTGGVESPKRVGVKKSKLNLKQVAPNWSLKESAGGPITKDEEEVVETLYALAGMFPDNDPDCNTKLDRASLEASSLALPEASESHLPKLEDSVAIKEDLNEICLSKIDEDVNPILDIEKSPEETVKISSLNGPSIRDPSDLPCSEQLHGGLDGSVAQMNLQELLVKHEEQKPPCNSVNFCVPPGPHQDTNGLDQAVKLEISLLDRKPEIALGQSMTIGSQLDQHHTISESKNNALWPGLSSTVSTTASHGPLSQSCAVKVPAWLGSRPGFLQNGSSSGKVSKVSTDRRSWKRCAAHGYISHLIRALQTSDGKESLPVPQNQLRPHEILKQGVLMTINDFNRSRTDLSGITSAASTIVNPVEKNSNDNKIGILQHLRPHQDNSPAALASGMYTSHKQSFNFLSLTAGGGGMEPNSSFNGVGNTLEPLAQLQVPYHAQHPTLVPFSMSQTRYTSAYTDQPSASQQAQLQLPSHVSSPYCVPHVSPKAMTKQQQQRLWAAQLAAQYRNNGTSTATTQFPGWQSGRQDSPVLLPCIPSPSTLEVVGPKYPRISQQQQHQQQHQFMAFPLSDARAKRQDHHISSVYEENGVGFRAGGGPLPLQLLCNERL
ncbi:uncharacterized protein LOC105635347 isoform X2 [Jatropha curcas]|uniref:uncharacterized protein LOC105635347 isoform X2 n=1 Tax=Jatropha curcas TaxID=180498 RepID=UPI0018960DBC|nr:uncharacterized protein LOC105635347 isoform X2 [Jatropha curcas]